MERTFLTIILLALSFLAGAYFSPFPTNIDHEFLREDELQYQLRREGAVPEGSIYFFGDSQLKSLYLPAVTCNGAKFAIGGESSSELLERVKHFRTLDRAAGFVLIVGFNDLRRSEAESLAVNIPILIKALPTSKPVVLVGVLPVNQALTDKVLNQEIENVNAEIRASCKAIENCYFLDLKEELVDIAGNLKQSLSLEDGVHLNSEGYAVLISGIREQLRNIDPDFVRCRDED